jgi:hypothetical protein
MLTRKGTAQKNKQQRYQQDTKKVDLLFLPGSTMVFVNKTLEAAKIKGYPRDSPRGWGGRGGIIPKQKLHKKNGIK